MTIVNGLLNGVTYETKDVLKLRKEIKNKYAVRNVEFLFIYIYYTSLNSQHAVKINSSKIELKLKRRTY